MTNNSGSVGVYCREQILTMFTKAKDNLVRAQDIVSERDKIISKYERVINSYREDIPVSSSTHTQMQIPFYSTFDNIITKGIINRKKVVKSENKNYVKFSVDEYCLDKIKREISLAQELILKQNLFISVPPVYDEINTFLDTGADSVHLTGVDARTLESLCQDPYSFIDALGVDGFLSCEMKWENAVYVTTYDDIIIKSTYISRDVGLASRLQCERLYNNTSLSLAVDELLQRIDETEKKLWGVVGTTEEEIQNLLLQMKEDLSKL